MKHLLPFPLRNRKGGFAIEAILSMAFVVMMLVMAIGYYSYMMPREALVREVQLLAQKAKIQGGLTGDATGSILGTDTEMFFASMEARGFDRDNIVLTCETRVAKRNCLDVTPIGSKGDRYIQRDDMEVMVIRAEIPVQSSLLGLTQVFFGTIQMVPEQYLLQESIMSERW